MLHILGMILKIIGIILAALLALLLLLALAVLFVPVKYRFAGSYVESVNGNGGASWLFHILSARFSIEEGVFSAKARLFGIPIFRADRVGEADDGGGDKKDGSEGRAGKHKKKKTEKKKEKKKRKKEEREEELKDGGILDKIKYTGRRICDTIKKITGSVSSFREWWEAEETKAAWALCRERVLLILKHIKPDVFEMDLTFGAGDPASTGEILAVVGMLCPMLPDTVRIMPRFDESVLSGNVKIKGKIRVVVLLRHAFAIYRDKNLRHALKKIRRSE